ncbi:protease HtpX [Paraferrimonas sedimenticola]|uniref:Protease HtpX n=1 Tax=Paraferrimonas sedimenticola TaxID=375674 RepID=A0AA37W1S7_9GAMM|nr:protease HtpX [Paraferrimonas sedimenticola]GLP96657.1 protease HtpX [Paraferrimonas sedimenticola]
MKRVLLFLATNMAILVVASIVMSILGVNTSTMSGLLVFCAIFGFGGSFISLLISKWMAKKSTGAQVIHQARDADEQWLLDTVARQAQQAGIKMPEVAIYHAPEMNAFATGPSRDNSLVAVSSGLLYGMTRDEVEAVLAHEVSHVANGDMVTLTLIQGVLNTFVMFLARLAAGAVNTVVASNDEEGEGMGFLAHMAVVIVMELLLGILASIIVAYFSRIREYRADEGGARLSSREKMAAALERLKGNAESTMPAQMAAFGISGKKSMAELLMSHPPLEKRIARLRQG